MSKMASTPVYMFLCMVGKCRGNPGADLPSTCTTLNLFGYVLGAHHLDLRAATAEDPDWLLDQRSSEIKLIRGWLDEHYDEKKAVSAYR